MTAIDGILGHWRRLQSGDYASLPMMQNLLRFYASTLVDQWMIRDVRSALVPLRMNEAQSRLFVVMLDQAAQGKPIRIVILKSRKLGISTFVQMFATFLCAYTENAKAITIAHSEQATKEIFDIARLAAECHKEVRPCDVTAELRWSDCRGHYMCLAAGGVAVAAGGTPSFLHLSELAKWHTNKESTFVNACNSVPYVPETIVVHESTARGRDLFFQLFDDARHDPAHQYKSIFAAWYLDLTLVAPVPDGFVVDEDEERLRTRAERDGCMVSDGQLQWRRNKIAEIGDDLFRQEYPSTAEEAIQGSKGLIFPHMRDALVSEVPFDPQAVPHSERVGGIDFGYNDPTAIWTGFYIDQVLWVTGFWRKSETLAADQVEGCRVGHHYFCDPANLTERTALGRACQSESKQCRFSAAPRRKNPGEDTARIEMQNVLKMIGDGRLRILHGVAAQLIVECDTLAWNEKTGKPDDQRSDSCGHFDSIKALTYLVMGVMNRKKEEPSERMLTPGRRSQWLGV